MEALLTTRQLQDLLRVDRITIYRMLNDGRLRGFKVGGQWRFPPQEIEAWLQEQGAGLGTAASTSAADAGPEPPSHLLPLTCIRAIQSVCAEAMGVAAVTVDPEGTPLSGVDNSCRFCDMILSTEAGRRRCAEAWRAAVRGRVQRCHAGLLCAGAPVAVNGHAVAVTAVCQFVARQPDGPEAEWAARLPELAWELGLPEEELRAAASSLRAVPESDVARVVALAGRMALTFEEIGHERVNLLGRLEKIAEMSRV